MKTERYWILSPALHRAAEERAGRAAEASGVVSVFISAGDEWVCDLCNATIESVVEGTYIPVVIPCEGSYALCVACAADGGYDGEDPSTWSVQGCGCEGCATVWNERTNAARFALPTKLARVPEPTRYEQ